MPALAALISYTPWIHRETVTKCELEDDARGFEAETSGNGRLTDVVGDGH